MFAHRRILLILLMSLILISFCDLYSRSGPKISRIGFTIMQNKLMVVWNSKSGLDKKDRSLHDPRQRMHGIFVFVLLPTLNCFLA